MGYPVAYRSGSEQYGGRGFQPPQPSPANDNVPRTNPAPEGPANDNERGGYSGPTKLSAGAARLGLRALGLLARGTAIGRVAQFGQLALSLYRADTRWDTTFPPSGQGESQYGINMPAAANGWELFCTGRTGPGFTWCGPFIIPQAVSCNLSGQAAGPLPCVAETEMNDTVTSYSVVWEYASFGSRYRLYWARYVRATALPYSTSRLDELPISSDAHAPQFAPRVRPAHWPVPYPPLQPIAVPDEPPAFVPYAARNRNDEWHQVGPGPEALPESPPSLPRRPPPRGTKEQKFNLASVGGVIRAVAGGVTEGHDFVEAVWYALPAKDRKPVRGRKARDGSTTLFPGDPGYEFGHRVHQTFGNMVQDLYNHWGDIDWQKAQGNIVKSLAIDALFGVPAIVATRNLSRSGYFGPAGSGGFRGFWGPAM